MYLSQGDRRGGEVKQEKRRGNVPRGLTHPREEVSPKNGSIEVRETRQRKKGEAVGVAVPGPAARPPSFKIAKDSKKKREGRN